MILKFQSDAITQLEELARHDSHSLLIEGASGCGKTYVAKEYTRLIHSSGCYSISPTVQSIRDTIDQMYNVSDKVVLCIENLDSGVISASHTLLKFLEEPRSNVYIVVTCRNRYKVPDTILSRSTVISMAYPTPADIEEYAQLVNQRNYDRLKNSLVWKGVMSLRDVDNLYKLTEEQIMYYDEITQLLSFKESVSNIVWRLQHYKDDSETDILFVMNYILKTTKNKGIQRKVIECVKDLSTSRIAAHAVLTKFVFDCKYGA